MTKAGVRVVNSLALLAADSCQEENKKKIPHEPPYKNTPGVDKATDGGRRVGAGGSLKMRNISVLRRRGGGAER